jgi:lipopolysaccharide/colanic/teichoic acid biosynthesis glycosyltransferase/acetyltransferase-like isoleucine patch superfamily enzyme
LPARYFDLKEQLFPLLYQRGAPTSAWVMPGYTCNITSIGDFFTANLDILNGQVPLLDSEKPQNSSNNDQTQVSASVKVFPPAVLGSGCRIGDEAIILGPSAIGSHSEIEAGVVVNECVILDNARIGQGAHLHRCVISDGAVISSWMHLHEMAVMQSLASPAEQTVFSLREQPSRHLRKVVGPLEWQTLPHPFGQIVKRCLDVILAILGLVITAPLMLAIALSIKLDSPGTVIFRQKRCGQRGRNFTMYKFRTMVNNSEDLKRELQDRNEVDGPMFKIIRDPRITRVGRILRNTNLDELPQFYNVLKGDMSLVGPRPLSLEEMRYNPKWRDARLSVRPGMSGLWQVEAHTKVFFNDWLVNDLEYVRQCSLGLDLRILFKTMRKAVRDLFLFEKK